MSPQIKLKIAGISTLIRSEFAFARLPKKQTGINPQRLINFLCKGKIEPDIIIDVKVVSRLPRITGQKNIFVTYHPDSHVENWNLSEYNGGFIYNTSVDKYQTAVVNKEFTRATAYLPCRGRGCYSWNPDDLIYDFLQVLMINYLALTKRGVIFHGMGVKDSKNGLLFAGESGAGKSTVARIWHQYSNAMVLNDDRIVARNVNGKFFIYGSPWHGAFDDYLGNFMEPAPLKKLFFIYHSTKNILTRLSAKEAFCHIYPVLFAPFWDRRSLIFNIGFCIIFTVNTISADVMGVPSWKITSCLSVNV